MSIVQRTTTYAVCPHCQQDAGEVDHLLGQQFTTEWYCNNCGKQYRLDFDTSGHVEITRLAGLKITTLDLLVLPPQKEPVYFVVEGMRFEGGRDGGERDEADAKQFLYEEHSCPTNWLQPKMVWHDGDSDPHGLIEYVAHVDADALPPDESHGPNDRDFALIALIEKHHAART